MRTNLFLSLACCGMLVLAVGCNQEQKSELEKNLEDAGKQMSEGLEQAGEQIEKGMEAAAEQAGELQKQVQESMEDANAGDAAPEEPAASEADAAQADDEARTRVREELSDLGKELRELGSALADAGKDAGEDLRQRFGNLEDERKKLSEGMAELGEKGEAAWNDTLERMDKYMEQLRQKMDALQQPEEEPAPADAEEDAATQV